MTKIKGKISFYTQGYQQVQMPCEIETDKSIGGEQGPQGKKGDKGDPLTYNDLTEAQKADIARPATEQAEIAVQQLEAIHQAIDNLDPSQSTSDAVVAEAATRASKDAELEADLAALGPKIDQGIEYGETETVIDRTSSYFISSITSAYITSSNLKVTQNEYTTSWRLSLFRLPAGKYKFETTTYATSSVGVILAKFSGVEDFVVNGYANEQLYRGDGTAKTFSFELNEETLVSLLWNQSSFTVYGVLKKRDITYVKDKVQEIANAQSSINEGISNLTTKTDGVSLSANAYVAKSVQFNSGGSKDILTSLKLKKGVAYKFIGTCTSEITQYATYVQIKGSDGTTISNNVLIDSGETSGNFTYTPDADYVDAKAVIAYNSQSSNTFSLTITATESAGASELDGREMATLHNGLPMIDKLTSTFASIKSSNRTLSPRVLSNFLLDMKFVGTPTTGCKYVLKGFQYAKNGEVDYANCLYIKRVNADTTETTLVTQYIGANAPTGIVKHTLSLSNDSGVTQCILLLDWDALKEIDNNSATYSNFTLITNGYVFDQKYLFDNTGRIQQDKQIAQLSSDVASLQEEIGVSGLDIVIPDVVYAIAGTELYLFNDTISLSVDRGLASPLNYQIRWSCSKGRVKERGFAYTPTDTDAGSTISCTCYMYNNSFALVQQKTFTIKVLAKNALSVAKNIAYFGDSLGSNSASAIYSRFNNSERFTGTIPTMVGTRGTTPKYDAVGGFRWVDYATKGTYAYRVNVANVVSLGVGAKYSLTISGESKTLTIREVNITDGTGNVLLEADYGARITSFPSTGTLAYISGTGDSSISFTDGLEESGNPLWNDTTNQLDVAQYKELCGLQSTDKIDAVAFQFGINDSFDATTITGYITALYNAFIADNPDCKFIVGLTTIAGNTADGYGANYGGGGSGTIAIKTKIHNFKKLYVSLVGSSLPNLRIATPGLQVDRYYGYGFSERNISQEYTTTEQYHNNYVHPAASGYRQIGDAYLAAFVGVLTE